ncbi:MAG TPA: hypothetical protein VHZ03_07580 [Trebonia sp.]|nr:hypothetical protein [Trebonia sp.]
MADADVVELAAVVQGGGAVDVDLVGVNAGVAVVGAVARGPTSPGSAP